MNRSNTTRYTPSRENLNRFKIQTRTSAKVITNVGHLTRAIKLKDVAEAAGVSQGTASNVWNKPELVRAELRERVLEAARVLGYAGPSPTGRLLRAGKANAIGIAAAEPLDYFFADPWARRLLTEVAEV